MMQAAPLTLRVELVADGAAVDDQHYEYHLPFSAQTTAGDVMHEVQARSNVDLSSSYCLYFAYGNNYFAPIMNPLRLVEVPQVHQAIQSNRKLRFFVTRNDKCDQLVNYLSMSRQLSASPPDVTSRHRTMSMPMSSAVPHKGIPLSASPQDFKKYSSPTTSGAVAPSPTVRRKPPPILPLDTSSCDAASLAGDNKERHQIRVKFPLKGHQDAELTVSYVKGECARELISVCCEALLEAKPQMKLDPSLMMLKYSADNVTRYFLAEDRIPQVGKSHAEPPVMFLISRNDKLVYDTIIEEKDKLNRSLNGAISMALECKTQLVRTSELNARTREAVKAATRVHATAAHNSDSSQCDRLEQEIRLYQIQLDEQTAKEEALKKELASLQ